MFWLADIFKMHVCTFNFKSIVCINTKIWLCLYVTHKSHELGNVWQTYQNIVDHHRLAVYMMKMLKCYVIKWSSYIGIGVFNSHIGYLLNGIPLVHSTVTHKSPDPSSPSMWPQPPQPWLEPSGLTRRQFDPVPDISTTPPMSTYIGIIHQQYIHTVIHCVYIQYSSKNTRETLVYSTLPREFHMSTRKAESLECNNHMKKWAINTRE